MKKCVIALVLVSLLGVSVQAAIVTMNGSDASGTTSFNTGLHWTGGSAPSAGNDYVTGDNQLRTPGNGNSYTFAGDSLTINNNSAYSKGLLYKGTGSTGAITISNLILNHGLVSHANGATDVFNLYGNINVAGDSTLYPKQGAINLYSAISGSSQLTILASDSPAGGGGSAFKIWIRSSANTYTGNIVNNGRLELADDANLNFVIGASGVNNSISNGTAGTQQHTIFDGDFIFNLTGASANLGDSWKIVNTVAASTYWNSTFNVVGFTSMTTGTSTVWNKAISNELAYQFDQATGTLSVVVPEPATMILLGLGGLLVSRKKR